MYSFHSVWVMLPLAMAQPCSTHDSGSTCQNPAIRTERQAIHTTSGALEVVDLFGMGRIGNIPQTDSVVHTALSQYRAIAIGAEGHTRHSFAVAGEGVGGWGRGCKIP